MRFILIIMLSCLALDSDAQTPDAIPAQKVIKLAELQYQAYIEKYPNSTQYPRSTNPDGSLYTTGSSAWTSGFFPGSLWYLYQITNKTQWRQAAEKWTEGIESQKTKTHTHDLGFMLYNSFGNGLKFTNNQAYKNILLQGANSLATRFDPEVSAIKSWDFGSYSYPVIIDNLMNLEYLFWAAKASGNSVFYKIAVAHANTDLKDRFRADNSSYHVLDYDPVSGIVLSKLTAQGYAHSSCWSRGQAWGIYGYTVLYRETKDIRYLEQAKEAADYFLSQTDKIADHIPYWDFQAPDIPSAPRDASSAAIAASALIELSKYAGANNQYLSKAAQLINSLCSDKYLAKAGANNYFLLMHSTGNKPNKSEIDVPIVYADYYLLEAIWRYQNYATLSF